MNALFRISDQPIDAESMKRGVRRDEAGGFVCFEGWVRNHHQGRDVRLLEYEAWTGLAEKEGARILETARQKFEIEAIDCVHRVGSLEVGDMAVCIAVSAAHRDAAFDACRFVIDEVKDRVPIWKKEHYSSGDSGWVGAG